MLERILIPTFIVYPIVCAWFTDFTRSSFEYEENVAVTVSLFVLSGCPQGDRITLLLLYLLCVLPECITLSDVVDRESESECYKDSFIIQTTEEWEDSSVVEE